MGFAKTALRLQMQRQTQMQMQHNADRANNVQTEDVNVTITDGDAGNDALDGGTVQSENAELAPVGFEMRMQYMSGTEMPIPSANMMTNAVSGMQMPSMNLPVDNMYGDSFARQLPTDRMYGDLLVRSQQMSVSHLSSL